MEADDGGSYNCFGVKKSWTRANFIHRWLFWWAFPVIRLGNRKELDVEDLEPVSIADSAELQGNLVLHAWQKELTERALEPSLFRAQSTVARLPEAVLSLSLHSVSLYNNIQSFASPASLIVLSMAQCFTIIKIFVLFFVSLTRAVYADADIYLLDDPLSAVDAAVGRHIFENCIRGLLREKCVALVTHQIQFIEPANQIIMLRSGRIEANLTFEQFRFQGGGTNVGDEGLNFFIDYYFDEKNAKSTCADIPDTQLDSTRKAKIYGTFEGRPKQAAEERSIGLVPYRLYWQFFRAVFYLTILLISMILTMFSMSCSDYWLKIWTDSKGQEGAGHPGKSSWLQLGQHEFVWVYCGLVGFLLVFSMMRIQLLYSASLNSSVRLHESLLAAITRAPMRFFEINSSGRILNRFINDMGSIDEVIPQFLRLSTQVFSEIFGATVIVAIVSPVSIIPALFLFTGFFYIRRFYLTGGSNLKRLEAIVRSPVFEHLSTSLSGLSTIRAFKLEDKWQEQFRALLDRHSSVLIFTIRASRWLGTTLDWTNDLFFAILAISLFCLDTTGGSAGLALTSGLSVVLNASYGVTLSADLANQFVCVERVTAYSKIEPEVPIPTIMPGRTLPKIWPVKGQIQFENLFVKYGQNPPVLHAISATIYPQEKIGIVGRTGAGKSSLISTLFRIVVPSSGSISIDHLNTAQIGLHEFRSRMAIIPQSASAVLFRGTIRHNLDPTGAYTDQALWQVLTEVQLAKRLEMESSGSSGLDVEVAEGGSNFSVGERQLISLARALLKGSKIVVLDEATAHLDPETDALIQRVVKTSFAHSTILTIAHRLDTVMDSDRICVIDNGRILEFGEPYILLQTENCWLSSLVNKTGKTGRRILTRIAESAYEKRREAQQR